MSNEHCIWSLDGEDYDSYRDYYSSCGNSFMLNEGNLKDNKFKFCPFCGKAIEEVTE